MTNLIVLRTIEQFMAGYTPAYNPIMPLFMDRAQAYSVDAGKVDFKRLDAVGDIRARMLGPKDTEIHQIGAKHSTKSFNKYFFGAQYVQSELQTTEGYEDVVAQVLDEHNKQNDSLFLTGEGTAANNVVNNGLFWSADANYVLKSSIEIAKATDGSHLADLYTQMVSAIQDAQQIDGRILVLTYGSLAIGQYNGLFAGNSQAFAKVIGDALDDVTFAKLPSAVTPAGANGFIIVNLDQVKLHYTLLPAIKGQGVNEEKQYAWTNFLMGSSMLEVQALGGVVRQPITLAA